jgi:dipeptidyl-peptidase-3
MLVDRVGSTGFVQLEAESFRKLAPREQALAYWLSQASIAIDPIIYDQLSRFGPRQKRLLENIVLHPQGVPPDTMKKIADFTKLFWANKGNHNENTSQKFLPGFTFEELKSAAGPNLAAEVDALKASLFDPDFEPMITAKSPRGSLDILQASANNFYSSGLSLADIKTFHEQYPLNSRLARSADGALVEQVYRAGTPDGKVPPGLYADELRQACEALEKARGYAGPEQGKPSPAWFASIGPGTRGTGFNSASTGCGPTRRSISTTASSKSIATPAAPRAARRASSP